MTVIPSSPKKGKGNDKGKKKIGGDGNASSPLPRPLPAHSQNDAAKRTFLSDRKFSNSNVREKLSESTLIAIRDKFGHEYLSKVQALTFDALMTGKDVFAVSKTGSGKTMAFLLPVIERSVLAMSTSISPPSSFVRVHGVVISPTKELAAQTYEEVVKLLSHVPAGRLRAELVIGGNDRSSDLRALSGAKTGGDIAVLVATPGRLEDHVSNTPGFADNALAHAHVVVLDEADRMLDAGFKKPLETILDAMRSPSRQTIMVTATLPPDVRQLAAKYMKHDAQTIDVAEATGQKDDDINQPRVNPAVRHKALVAPHSIVYHAALQSICEHAASHAEFKVIVFFPFKRQVQLMAELFRQVLPSCLGPETQILEIHSDLQQAQRDRASNAFRNGKRVVLLGTDVIARGVDYPDVTFVLQVGLTDRDTYVHRVGRTGRAGRSGEALLVISKFEEPAMRKRLDGYGTEWLRAEDPDKSRAQNSRSRVQGQLPPAMIVTVSTKPELEEKAAALAVKQASLFRRAYTAWLGFYGSEAKDIGVRKDMLEREAAAAYAPLGLERPPEISPETRKKMGFPLASTTSPTAPNAPNAAAAHSVSTTSVSGKRKKNNSVDNGSELRNRRKTRR
jgi:ATP-dependent RNA helicase MSS116